MGLSTLDLGVIAVYLAGVTAFGFHFRGGQQTLKGYFLADGNIPWWAITLSIVAAETSTLTVISVPGLAYEKDFSFLQLAMGYLVGRVIVSVVLLPQYFRGELVTAYQLIGRRFGHGLRMLTAGIFLVTRAAAEGVRVFAVALVIQVALGGLLKGMSNFGRDLAAIAIVGVLTLVYTLKGGMKAAIWTDVIHQTVYVTGAIVPIFVILHMVPGGWAAAHRIAGQAGKFRVFDFTLDLTTKYTLWSGVIGGAFLTTASHGTDQLIVQRLLSARSQWQAKAALLTSGAVIFFQFSLFLLIGALLFVFYRAFPPQTAFTRTDTIFPTFIVRYVPHGLCGLLIAAILAAAMSNLSAALNSLSSTTIVDFYAWLRPETSEQSRIRLSRLAMAGWTVVLVGMALLARHGGKVIEVGLSIASVTYGGVLGVFLLGVLSRKATECGAMIGMICGLALNLVLWLFTGVSFTWYVAMGSLVTFGVGYVASLPGGKTVVAQ